MLPMLITRSLINLGVFRQQTGTVSDQNTTDFTPAGKSINVIKPILIYFSSSN